MDESIIESEEDIMRRERERKYHSEYRIKNKEKIKADKAKYRIKNKERLKKSRYEWGLKNKERLKKYRCEWKIKNKEKLKKYNSEYQIKNKEKTKEYFKSIRDVIKCRRYGLHGEWYKEKLIEQNGKCAICGTDKPGGSSKKLCIDHCHKTKKARGLLCQKCNTGIGHFYDDINILESAKQYLIKYNSEGVS